MPSVGNPIPHDSAIGHVTGTAEFIDDITPRTDELVVGFVGSPVACGRLDQVDISEAEKIEGVVGIFTACDVEGQNTFGPVIADEPFLAEDELLYLGQPIVIIAAESRDVLTRARDSVKITATPAEPILSINKARQKERFLARPHRIARGDANKALESSPYRMSGKTQTGGQEQFYFESQAAIAYPGEEGQLIVNSSTQNPTKSQTMIARVLGLAQHQVVCLCKRMGGGFGGKETQAILPSIMAAFVAQKAGRAARVIYTKDDDMKVTGKRHAFLAEWEVGYDEEGQILAARFDFYSDGGATTDLSLEILDRAMLHAENAYYIPDIEINGQVCFTNYPPNTAFRGFGGPQGICNLESIIEDIAAQLRLDSYEVRRRNVYGTEDCNVTPYGQVFERNHLPEILDSLVERSGYKQRRGEIAQSNAQSTMRLRGIAMTAVKFGISFTSKFMNQANALVNVYTDGTIQVSTGGTEMGQGLNTKLRQLVADEFSVDPSNVILMPTSTEKNNNTSPTAASATTDLNGTAAVRACRAIRGRLAQFAARKLLELSDDAERSPDDVVFEGGFVHDRRQPKNRVSFAELTNQAHRDRVDLGARGFYATPVMGFDRETGRGEPFFYYTQGAAVSEVSIDRFTGDLSVPRVDLLIDIGKSINPGVDMGQITGGFIQGMGWVTAEQLVYDEGGALLSYSPTTYKIPGISDVPEHFRCELFDNDDNVENIAKSKAVNEPPLMLAISVWAAVKQALTFVAAGRRFELRVPATAEEILRCLTELQAAEELQASKPGDER